MKFKDIPKFTKTGNYQVSISLKSLKDNLQHYTERYQLELCPDFQRGYVWNEKQQIAFVEYIIKGGKSANIIYFNMQGWMNSFEGKMLCVDGLQRLTACLKFMNNELPIFNGNFYSDFEDTLPSSAELLFNVNDLNTRAEILQWYIDFNTGGTVHTEEDINKVRELLEKEK